MTHKEIIQDIYDKALDEVAKQDYSTSIPDETAEQIRQLVARSEASKGMMTVLITLFIHKIVNPEQDIRYHQAQQPNGFAGRSIDKDIITPFMKSVSFPSMSESGWLTRSLEQPHPYTLDYPGKIKPQEIKLAFLQLIDKVQCQGMPAYEILKYTFKLLIKQRDDQNIELDCSHH